MGIKKRLKGAFSVIICYGAILVLLLFSPEISQGVKNGVGLCLNIIIPSMFLFMILSSLIINSSLKYAVAKPFKPMRRLLKLSDNEMTVLLLSLIGGYPVGARLLANEVRKKSITSDKASKMLAFCVNGSPAFLISGIGVGIFSNLKAGVYLYIAQVVSCLFTAWIMSFFYKPQEGNEICRDVPANKVGISSLIIYSVSDSVKAMAAVCGLTISFCGIMPLLGKLPINKTILVLLKGLLEITTGCNETVGFSNKTTLVIISVFCSFGGICVFFQLCAMLNSCVTKKISLKWFISLKIVNVLTNVIITLFLSAISPIEGELLTNVVTVANADAMMRSAQFYSNSPTASLFLLFLSIMLLFFNKKSARI